MAKLNMQQFQRKLEQWTRRFPHLVYAGLELGAIYVVGVIQRDYLTGPRPQKLRVVSHTLRRSITHRMTSGPAPKAAVGTNVKYAAIHEYGGTIKHPGGTAYFPIEGGKVRFVSNEAAAGRNYPRTGPHDIKMPARPFVRPGIRKGLPTVARLIAKTVVGGYGP